MEASTSKDCFILWQGKVQVTSVNLVGKTLLLAELGPGELVGEMGLIRNEQRSASVTAIRPSKGVASEPSILRIFGEPKSIILRECACEHTDPNDP